MPRDDFSAKTKKILSDRVNRLCSNPNCRAPTGGPSTDPYKAKSIGTAAHITAASSGGPRYDASLSSTERQFIDNGIWLCTNCSVEIDKDPDRYPAELLRRWKALAESKAQEEIGRRNLSNQDTINTLAVAFTGHPKSFIANAIENVHKGSAKSLEDIDPRFSVDTSYSCGTTKFRLTPTENIPFRLIIKGEEAKRIPEKHKYFLDHGGKIELDVKDISFKGSALLEYITSDFMSGKLIISQHQKPAKQKIWLINKNTGICEILDDIEGHLSYGMKTISFKGQCYDGMLTINYTIDHREQKTNFTINMNISFDAWKGKPIDHLPYLDKLHSFISKIENGWQMHTSFEIEGKEMYKAKDSLFNDMQFVYRNLDVLDFTKNCIIIANYARKTVRFDPGITASEEEFFTVAETAGLIREPKSYTITDLINSEGSVATSTLVVEKDNPINDILLENKPVRMIFEEKNRGHISLFGTQVELPDKTHIFDHVIPKIDRRQPKLIPGQSVNVEWFPAEGFSYTIEL